MAGTKEWKEIRKLPHQAGIASVNGIAPSRMVEPG